jgi:RNA recognition motif-containing protein
VVERKTIFKENELPKHKQPRGRGFGFVQYLSIQDAAQAIKAVNGTKLLGRYGIWF